MPAVFMLAGFIPRISLNLAFRRLSIAGILVRMNFAASIASGQVPGVKVDASRWKGMDNAAIARALLGREASKQTLDAIGTGLEGKDPSPAVVASLVLGSPDFERR
jgi:hypothetical protein